jgi:general stress protein 26
MASQALPSTEASDALWSPAQNILFSGKDDPSLLVLRGE